MSIPACAADEDKTDKKAPAEKQSQEKKGATTKGESDKPDSLKVKEIADLIKKGDALLRVGKTEEALSNYKTALKDAPDNAGLRQRLAKAYYRKGDVHEAVRHLRTAVDLDHEQGIYHSELAWLYTKVGRLNAAIRHARIATNLNPQSAYPYIILGYSYGCEEQYDKAIETLSRAIKLTPEDITAHSYLADIYLNNGQYAEALDEFKKSLELEGTKSTNPKNLVKMGTCYGKLGKRDLQLECYEKAIKRAPDDPEAYGHLGFALSQTGDFVGAMNQGFKANVLRLKSSWEQFMGMFISVWAGIFIVFGIIFAAIAFGAGFTPQSGEDVIKSFFLVFYKDRPGRFVLTTRRVVFVPELISRSFGATRISIERDLIGSVQLEDRGGNGIVTLKSSSDTVHSFRMPKLVYDPLVELLKEQSFIKSADVEEKSSAQQSDTREQEKEDKQEEGVVADSFDFRPESLESSDEESGEGSDESDKSAEKTADEDEKSPEPQSEQDEDQKPAEEAIEDEPESTRDDGDIDSSDQEKKD